MCLRYLERTISIPHCLNLINLSPIFYANVLVPKRLFQCAPAADDISRVLWKRLLSLKVLTLISVLTTILEALSVQVLL